MKTLIFAIIASYNAQRRQKCVVAEPQKFQSFDLEALRNPADNMSSRLEVPCHKPHEFLDAIGAIAS